MFKLLVLALQVVGLSLLGAGPVFWWDRHAPIGWHAHVLFWHPGFDLPDSLQTQRDKALIAAQMAQDATKACRASLDSQNAAIAALARDSAAKLAAANRDIEAARAVAESHRQAAEVLRSYVPKGDDELSRWRDADREIGEAFK